MPPPLIQWYRFDTNNTYLLRHLVGSPAVWEKVFWSCYAYTTEAQDYLGSINRESFNLDKAAEIERGPQRSRKTGQ